jgi:ABC-2 type transport system ATP-binding protein
MIEARHLTKYFGQKTAVDDISFTVGPGEVLGFLGPNAAGKSTTMRMLTGFLPPTAGTAVIGGHDITVDTLQAQRKIGYLPENAPVYPDMTVLGFLDFVADVRGFRGQEKTKRIEETVERCFLEDVRFQSISTLSKGFKQRVCFAQSILHDPEYLIMDEPTDGLDPNQKHEVRGMIREMAKEKTIILSTHNLEEVDAVCTRAVIIAAGRIVADDSPEKLRSKSSLYGAVRFTVQRPEGMDPVQGLRAMPGIRTVDVLEEKPLYVTLRAYPEDTQAPVAEGIMAHFLRAGVQVSSLFVESGRLDEVFRMITTSQCGAPEDEQRAEKH